MTKNKTREGTLPPADKGVNDARPGLPNTHRTETRCLGPTRTNNIRRYTTTTAEPRHNMGRAEHRQVQAGKRVPGTLNHSGPDKGVGPER